MPTPNDSALLVSFKEKPSRILGIMQPYFLPYFEQFRLISACDLWIAFDTPQFVRKSWINRNRIINREKGWTYLSYPVKHSGIEVAICDSLIDEGQDWRRAVMERLSVYRREAPNYNLVRDLIRTTLEKEFRNVAELNLELLKVVAQYLGIRTPILSLSSLGLELPERCAAGEWALVISKKLGALEYRNSSGGAALFDRDLYTRSGIELTFHEHINMHYSTGRFQFVENLSVIDYLMWNDLQQLQEWLMSAKT